MSDYLRSEDEIKTALLEVGQELTDSSLTSQGRAFLSGVRRALTWLQDETGSELIDHTNCVTELPCPSQLRRQNASQAKS